MMQIEKSTEIAHDLMLIQQERMNFYEQAAKLFSKDDDVYRCLQSIANQCLDFILELRPYAELRFADPADFSDVRGDIYHRWQIQDITPGSQPADMICTFEENERAICNAYEIAMDEEENAGRNLRVLFSRQLKRIGESLATLQSHKKPTVPDPVSKEKKSCVMWTTRV